jgi:uncharacterized protein (TIGR03067 family)
MEGKHMTHRQYLMFTFWSLGITIFSAHSAAAQDKALKGNWQAVELVDNGKVIAPEAIPTWLPSGGKIEILDNSIAFTSPKDGKRYSRVFSVDATTYPRQLNVYDDGKLSGQGIYRIEEGRLIVCLSPPSAPRPTDFSARENSQRAMIVLTQKDEKSNPSATPAQTVSTTPTLSLPSPPPLPAAAKPLTDAEIGNWLPGTWKYKDAYGDFFLSLDRNGTYSTYRESVEKSAFQQVFKKLPLSSGTWKLKNGQVVLQCTSAIYLDRVCKTFPFTIRSVNATDMEFVDYAGNAGKAVRTKS